MSRWRLLVRVERDGRVETTLPFSLSPLTIGSSPRCDVVLGDPYVSSEHGIVTVSRGQISYQDRSRNGSFVDGRRVEQVSLGAEGQVSIPPFVVVLSLDMAAEDATTLIRPRGTVAPAQAEGIERPSTPKTASRIPIDESTKYLPLPVAAAVPTLRVSEGPDEVRGQVFALDAATVVIGRGAQAHVRIDRTTVSRCHAELRRQPDGRWLAVDLESANGIAVNGRRVAKQLLAPGDRLAIGPEIVMDFINPDDSTPPPPDDGDPVGGLRLRCAPAKGEADVSVLRLAGRVDGYNYTELKQGLASLIDAGQRFLILDLADTTYIDHTGFGVLVNAEAQLRQLKGQLLLVHVGERISAALALLRLDDLLRVVASENEAWQQIRARRNRRDV